MELLMIAIFFCLATLGIVPVADSSAP